MRPSIFDAIDSSRIRLGAKLEYLASAQCTPYVGLAYEHEFDGKAKGSVEGMALPSADLGGDTGILSAGINFKPSKSLPLTVKAAFTGRVGEHRGAAGLFKVRYDF